MPSDPGVILPDPALPRCSWCTHDPLYQHYHDTEWGVPNYDARHLFEKLILEGFQAGLSWLTVLRKRERFRQQFFNFDVEQVADMSDDYIERLLQDPGLIRNRLKMQAARKNARAWMRLDDPVDTVWSIVGGRPQLHHYVDAADIPTVTPQAEQLSRLLKRDGFSFVGPTICQSYLQAVGAFMDHTTNCHRHAVLSRLE